MSQVPKQVFPAEKLREFAVRVFESFDSARLVLRLRALEPAASLSTWRTDSPSPTMRRAIASRNLVSGIASSARA